MALPGSDKSLNWFDEWLVAQNDLQREAFGVDPALAGPDYLMLNLLGVIAEMGEVMQEVDWRPWSSSQGHIAPGLVGEIVDVLHFVGNIILWAGIGSDELTDVYVQKILENTRRQEDGYANMEDS